MCLICVEFDKLSIIEARRNLTEMSAGLGGHAAEVKKRIDDREVAELAHDLVEKWMRTGLLDGLKGRSSKDLAKLIGPAHAGHLLREIKE